MTQRVIIIGGGMVGLAIAVAVASTRPDLSISVLEARALPSGEPSPLDSRASALNIKSRELLASWGVWQALDAFAAPINKVHVSRRQHFGSSCLLSSDIGAQALGYVAENHRIGRALFARASELGIVFEAPCKVIELKLDRAARGVVLENGEIRSADLILLADGSNSSLRSGLAITTRQTDSGQHAVVANCECTGPANGTAYERFTQHGPLAFLPLPARHSTGSRFNVVWSTVPERARTLLELSDDQFATALQREFGWRQGRITAVGRRTDWPLISSVAHEQLRPGCIVVGNAAHALHPVAGQGLNLSLRDAHTLATVLERASDIAAANVLQQFVSASEGDQASIVAATNFLAGAFTDRSFVPRGPRMLALASLDIIPPLRKSIASIGSHGLRSQHERASQP